MIMIIIIIITTITTTTTIIIVEQHKSSLANQCAIKRSAPQQVYNKLNATRTAWTARIALILRRPHATKLPRQLNI
jgi:hypothetical protein